MQLGDPVKLWRNVGSGDAARPAAMGNWLAVKRHQPGPNRDAIGAWIEVQVGDATLQRREVTVGGGHVGGQLGWIHVGLGTADRGRGPGHWPDGEAGPVDDAWRPNQFVEIDRGDERAAPMAAGPAS